MSALPPGPMVNVGFGPASPAGWVLRDAHRALARSDRFASRSFSEPGFAIKRD